MAASIRLYSVSILGIMVGMIGCRPRKYNENDSKNRSVISSGLPPGLDVNDVSVLFPYPTNKTELEGLLKIGEKSGDGLPLITDLQFKQITDAVTSSAGIDLKTNNFGTSDASPNLVKNNWRVVSFRYDPCAPFLQEPVGGALPKTCRSQIRLVAQPFIEDGTSIHDDDFTMHIVYEFTEEESRKQAFDLLKLKNENSLATSGKPLGIHPAMPKGSDLNGKVAGLFRSFILGNVSSAKLGIVAFMGLSPSPEPWRFIAGSMNSDGAGGKKFDIGPQAFPNNVTKNFQELKFIGTPDKPVSPSFSNGRVMDRPNTAVLFAKASLTDAADGNDPARIVTNIDNPALAGLAPRREFDLKNAHGEPPHRDCVSCHTTTSRALDLAVNQQSGLRDSAAFEKMMRKDTAFKPKPGITGFPVGRTLQTGNWNVRNFGYLFGTPAIAIRTLNETADVADFTNRVILKNSTFAGGHANPAPFDCTGKEPEVWKCVVEDKDTNDFNVCMKICATITGKTLPAVAAKPVVVASGGALAPATRPGDAPAAAAPGTKNGVCETEEQTFIYTKNGINMGDVGPSTLVNTDGILHDVTVGGKVQKMIRVRVDEKFTVGQGIANLPTVGNLKQGFIKASICKKQ